MIGPFKNHYDFLSNFYSSPITYDGFNYPTVEHGYQASKSLDYNIRFQVAKAKTAAEAKKMGRNIQGLRPYWDTIKISIMKDLVAKKFAIPELRMKLLGTGDEKLVEVNWWGDIFWGVCDKLDNGENHLGIILMEVRQEIKDLIGMKI